MALKFHTKLDKLGKVSLPQEIISELQLKPGMSLVIEASDGKISLEPISEEPELINKNGILVVRPKITGDIKNVIQRDRQARIDKIIRDFGTK